MNLAKRIISAVLCLAMVAATTSCAQTSTSTSTSTSSTPTSTSTSTSASTEATTDVVEVEFWHSMGGGTGELLESIIQDYNSSQDEVHVTGTYQGNYLESIAKIQPAIANGVGPDVIQSGTGQMPVLASEDGVLEDLIPYMQASGMETSDFVPAFFTGMGYDENPTTLTALPMGSSTPVLYCNMDILNAAGEKVPTSWDEMRTLAAKLIADGTLEYGFAMPYGEWFYWMIMGEMGATPFNEDGTALGCIEDGTGVAAIQLLKDMSDEKTLFYGPAQDSGTVCKQMFYEGKVAFYVDSCAALKGITKTAEFDLAVNFVPAGKEFGVPSGGNGLAILGSSEKKEAAWKFLEWMYSDEGGIATFVTSTGYLPCRYSMSDMKIVADAFEADPNYSVSFDQLVNGNNEHMKHPLVGDTTTPINNMLSAVMYDGEDVTEQMNILNNEIMDIFAD